MTNRFQSSRQSDQIELSPLSVLYHPHFEPDLATLRRALLVNDAVRSIVPASANYRPSPALFKHMETLPDTFVPTSPLRDDVNIASDYYTIGVLKNAFRQLSRDRQPRQVSACFSRGSGRNGPSVSIRGMALLHTAKVASIVYDELKSNNLVFGERGDGNILVDERAANLIVSYLAQRMSKRLRLRTVTDYAASYFLSTACDVDDTYEPDRNAVFASALLQLHIPAAIGVMDHKAYVELRKRYSELRESFPLYLEDLRQLYRVADRSSARELAAVVRDIDTKLNSHFERIKASNVAGAVGTWVPFGLASAFSIAALCFSKPELAGLFTLSGIVVQGIGLGVGPKNVSAKFDGVRSLLISANNDVRTATGSTFPSIDLMKYIVDRG